MHSFLHQFKCLLSVIFTKKLWYKDMYPRISLCTYVIQSHHHVKCRAMQTLVDGNVLSHQQPLGNRLIRYHITKHRKRGEMTGSQCRPQGLVTGYRQKEGDEANMEARRQPRHIRKHISDWPFSHPVLRTSSWTETVRWRDEIDWAVTGWGGQEK